MDARIKSGHDGQRSEGRVKPGNDEEGRGEC
jgi:hypothetical protein